MKDDTDETLSVTELEHLLRLAHQVVVWTGQDTIRREAAGTRALTSARASYLKSLIDIKVSHGIQLTTSETGGCTCDPHHPDPVKCLYHYAAAAQPGNHRIPWNCPTYYDGCNCDQDKG